MSVADAVSNRYGATIRYPGLLKKAGIVRSIRHVT